MASPKHSQSEHPQGATLKHQNATSPDVGGHLAGGFEEASDNIDDVRLIDIPILIIFFLLFMIVALQFFTRYVLNDSLGWTEEIARYFIILLGFVGGITCVRKNKHIFLEFAFHFLPPKVLKPIAVMGAGIVTLFWGYAGVLAIELASKTRANMVSIAIPKAYLYYIVAASCFLMAVFAAQKLIEAIKDKNRPEINPQKINQGEI